MDRNTAEKIAEFESAIKKYDAEKIQAMLENKEIDVNIRLNEHGDTALTLAMKQKRPTEQEVEKK